MRVSTDRPRTIVALVALGVLLGAGPARAQSPRTIQDGTLDWIELHADAPGDVPILVKRFDAAGANLGTGAEGGKVKRVDIAKMMQSDGPELLAEALVAELGKVGFSDVRQGEADVPAGGLVIEGRFTILDPGSKAKRYWVGFGAGKGSVEVEGTVRDSDGDLLARFRQKRITVMGVGGGNYRKKMTSDCRSIGEDIARFLERWSSGKDLKG